MTIVATHYMSDLPRKDTPLPHHTLGLQYAATGYGRRIPTAHMVQLPGSKRWRRVYCCIYSNAGTCYVQANGGKDWVVIA